MSCQVCSIDTVANPATKRVEFPEHYHGPNGHSLKDNVFLVCDKCASGVKEGTAIITDLEAPDA